MRRVYEDIIQFHIDNENLMMLIAGPRRVGKTTTSSLFMKDRQSYSYNWDIPSEKKAILLGFDELVKPFNFKLRENKKPLIVLDEIHKFDNWKSYLKGFYDAYHKDLTIIVTGSARLDIFNSGGESMMGRYFLYRMHPLSVGEILHPQLLHTEIHKQQKISKTQLEKLLQFGGFPQPFIRANKSFSERWNNTRHNQLFKEEILDLTKVHEVSRIEKLAFLLDAQVGKRAVNRNLGRKVEVSSVTIKRWLVTLEAMYYCFPIKPWSSNITRSLIKEPKYYLWDWTLVHDRGQRIENFIASHLLKAVHMWTDIGLGRYDLFYLRDREKREVDFLVTKNGKPWFLAECKSSMNSSISPSLHYFQKQTKAPHAFQVAFDMPFVDADCFSHNKPIIVPAATFLSQLV